MPSPDNVNKKIASLPHDGNKKGASAVFMPIVNGAGKVVNYLPLLVTDNGDGTATLEVNTTVQATFGDAKVGSSNGQTSGDKYLKVLSDGTLISRLTDTGDTEIDPATEDKQDDMISALASVVSALDVNLSTIASEATLQTLATEATLDDISTRINGQVDSNNSTTTPLGISGTFTGTATDALNTAMISIMVRSDQASATDGLVIEWSPDGTNWDDDDKFTIPANNGKFYTFGPQSRFFRVIYTNGAVAQGAFRLQTILKPFAIKPSSHRIDAAIVDEDDATLSKAVITGKAPDGSYQNARTTSNGSIQVARLEEAELERGTLFIATLSRDTSGGSPAPEALFINEGGTAIRIYRAVMGYRSNAEWEIYLNPTITANGTLLGKLNLRTGSGNTTSANMYDTPTVTANGTLLYAFHSANSVRESGIPGAIILGPGHSVLLRRVTSGGGNKLNFNVIWGTSYV